jgi:prepilin-type N-terminal cleavage/methylation domain-containing protein
MATYRPGRRGFTIVELLTVIGILGVLVGLLFPALASARRKAIKTDELNDLRQVGVAWTIYANSNNDAALPGYLATDVQQRWKVSYDYPDLSPIPPAPDYSPSDPNIAGPWTWRLMPHLSYSHQLIHRYADEDDLSRDELLSEAEETSLTPAFAYNAYYMGGWWEMTQPPNEDQPRPLPRFWDAVDPETLKPVPVVTRTVASLRRSSGVITFCSAAILDKGIHKFNRVNDQIPGSHFVVPPFLETTAIWDMARDQGGGGGGGGEEMATRSGGDPYTLEVLESEFGGSPGDAVLGIPIGRYNGLVALLFGDGHTDQQTPGALADQRFWIDAATCALTELADGPCHWTHRPPP